jgi:hypothetical protein
LTEKLEVVKVDATMNRRYMRKPNLWQYGVYEMLAIAVAALVIYKLPAIMAFFQ